MTFQDEPQLDGTDLFSLSTAETTTNKAIIYQVDLSPSAAAAASISTATITTTPLLLHVLLFSAFV